MVHGVQVSFVSVLMLTKELKLVKQENHQRHVIDKAVLLRYMLYHSDVKKQIIVFTLKHLGNVVLKIVSSEKII